MASLLSSVGETSSVFKTQKVVSLQSHNKQELSTTYTLMFGKDLSGHSPIALK